MEISHLPPDSYLFSSPHTFIYIFVVYIFWHIFIHVSISRFHSCFYFYLIFFNFIIQSSLKKSICVYKKKPSNVLFPYSRIAFTGSFCFDGFLFFTIFCFLFFSCFSQTFSGTFYCRNLGFGSVFLLFHIFPDRAKQHLFIQRLG